MSTRAAQSTMSTDEVIALAVESGWSDDSRWAPKFMLTALSREQDDMLATVSVYTDGKVRWTATPSRVSEPGRRQRGTAATVAEAMRSALGSVQAATGTLF